MTKNLKGTILKSSFTAITLTLIGAIFAYIIRIIYSQTLSIESYGLFYAMFGLFAALSTYADLGFGEAISYFIPKYFKQKNYSKLWNTFLYGQFVQISVSLLLALLLAFSAPFLAENYFKVSGSETLVYIFCLFLILSGFLNGINQIFTGLQKAFYFSTINTMKNLLILTFSLTALIFGSVNVNTYGQIWLLAYGLTAALYLFLLWTKHKFLTANKLIKSFDFLKSLSAYAIPAFFTTFIYSLIQSSDIFFLTLFRGVVEVGVYNVIVPIASIAIIFLSPLHNILLPLTSYLMEGEKKRLGQLLTKIYKIIPFIGLYFGLFIILFPSAIISFIFGDKWLSLSGFPLSILTFGYIFLLMGNLLGTIALGLGRIKERLRILSIIGVINIILDAFFIWKFGILGSVIIDSLIAVVLVITFTIIIKRWVEFSIPYQYYFKILLICLTIFAVVRITKIEPINIIELIAYGLIYSLLFLLIGYLLKIYDKSLIAIVFSKSK